MTRNWVHRKKRLCACGRRIGRVENVACGPCNSRAVQATSVIYRSTVGHGSSHAIPGHDLRMAKYMERASKRLPLFD